MFRRKADFTIVEAIVSKDMRRLQVIWDCKPVRKDEVLIARSHLPTTHLVSVQIADLITRDAGKLRKVVTARAKYGPQMPPG